MCLWGTAQICAQFRLQVRAHTFWCTTHHVGIPSRAGEVRVVPCPPWGRTGGLLLLASPPEMGTGQKQPKQFPRLLLRPLGRSCWGQEGREGSGFQGAAQAGCQTRGGDQGLGAVPVPSPCAHPRVPACVLHISAAEAVFLPAPSACCCEAVPIRLAVGCSSPRLLPAFDKPPAPLAPA